MWLPSLAEASRSGNWLRRTKQAGKRITLPAFFTAEKEKIKGSGKNANDIGTFALMRARFLYVLLLFVRFHTELFLLSSLLEEKIVISGHLNLSDQLSILVPYFRANFEVFDHLER